MGLLGRILVEAPDVVIELNGVLWSGRTGPRLNRLVSVKMTPDEAEEYGQAMVAAAHVARRISAP
jgi:hypothetical protein